MMLVHAHHGLDLDGKPVAAGVSRYGEVEAIAGAEAARLSPDGAERLAAWLIVSAAAGRARFAGTAGAEVIADMAGVGVAMARVAAIAAETLAVTGGEAPSPEATP